MSKVAKQLSFIYLLTTFVFAQDTHFTTCWAEYQNPYMPMNFWVIGEEDAGFEVGDEVALFDGDLCVGASLVESVPVSITNSVNIIASQDDGMGQPGFTAGNPITIKVWDASEEIELVVDTGVVWYDPSTGLEIPEPTFEALGFAAFTVPAGYIGAEEGPTADFSGNPLTGEYPLELTFTDESEEGSSAIVSWSWDFGDGGNSTDQNPVYTYESAGSYTVSLTVTDENGLTDTETKEDYIMVTEPVGPHFETVWYGNPYQVMNFFVANYATIDDVDISPGDEIGIFDGEYCVGVGILTEVIEGMVILPIIAGEDDPGTPEIDGFTHDNPISYKLWDASEGIEVEDVVATYTEFGEYITDGLFESLGSAMISLAGFAPSIEGPTAEFSAEPTEGYVPLVVTFTDESVEGSSAIVSWDWDFGDGGSSTDQNPVYTYESAGIYTVSLTVMDENDSTDTETKDNYITVNEPVPPTATFTAEPMEGNTPLTVTFTNTSDLGSGVLISYLWDFGDGETSNEENPVHTYTFTDYVRSHFVTCWAEYQNPYMPMNFWVIGEEDAGYEVGDEVALFDGELCVGAGIVESVPLSISNSLNIITSQDDGIGQLGFTTGNPITIKIWDESGQNEIEVSSGVVWYDIGTGEVIPEPMFEGLGFAAFTLSSVGGVEGPVEYEVTLTVTTTHGSDTSDAVTITVYEAVGPTAEFSAEPTEGDVPLTVEFTDESIMGSSDIISWYWEFGDGGTSTDQSPVYTYESPGVYTVNLTVTDESGLTDMETKEDYITVQALGPETEFSADITEGYAPLEVTFTDESVEGSSAIVSWDWDFGDGGSSTDQDPVYTYESTGVYTVSLTVMDENGLTDTETKEDYIIVNPSGQPLIISIIDRPNDQGGYVYVTFQKSIYDTDTLRSTEGYSIERWDDSLWVTVQYGYAYGADEYSYEATTLRDSTESDDGMTQFRVIAGMDEGTWASEPEWGYSVDNIAPGEPQNLTAIDTTSGIQLEWSPSEDEDFQYHNVYRSPIDSEPWTLIAQTVESTYFDLVTTGTYVYVVTAVDYAGNESDYSEPAGATVSIDEELIPEVFSLHQNYPNPFNPFTTIRFDVPEENNVNIIVYDMLGREVRTLISSFFTPSVYSVVWDGTNNDGNVVPNGIYFYRMVSGEFIQVRKLVFLK